MADRAESVLVSHHVSCGPEGGTVPSSLFSWTLAPCLLPFPQALDPVIDPRVSLPCWPLRPTYADLPSEAGDVPVPTPPQAVSLPLFVASLVLNVCRMKLPTTSHAERALAECTGPVRASPHPHFRLFPVKELPGSCWALPPCPAPLTLPSSPAATAFQGSVSGLAPRSHTLCPRPPPSPMT